MILVSYSVRGRIIKCQHSETYQIQNEQGLVRSRLVDKENLSFLGKLLQIAFLCLVLYPLVASSVEVQIEIILEVTMLVKPTRCWTEQCHPTRRAHHNIGQIALLRRIHEDLLLWRTHLR